MTTAASCCSAHSPTNCCDPEDCRPCCPRCSTCPTVAARRATPPLPRAERVVGFRGPEACAAARVTYRQLDYWCRTGLVEPTVRPAHGSGTQRLYSREDVVALRLVRELLDAGICLRMIRDVLPRLLAAGGEVRIETSSPHTSILVDVAGIAASTPPAPLYSAEPQTPALTVVP